MTTTDPTPTGSRNGFGVAALVLGIVAVVTALNGWWLFLLPIALAGGILAVVFGRRGRRLADEGEATNRGQATAGLVLGTTALGLVLAGGIAFAAFGDRWDRHDWKGDDTFSECVDDADGTSDLLECVRSYPEEAADAGIVLDG
jgi:hypothetical protein